MLVRCLNCNQQVDGRIDKETDIVVCMNCRGECEVTEFVKNAMRQNREFLEKEKSSFGFRCDTCREIQPAVTNKEGTKAYCTKCGGEITNVSPFMVSTMRRMGKIKGAVIE